ncbi:MAG: FAD-binding oxidoreductase [Candidatus Thermoplasmatota archaeon]|nr:FAD-binding oxidoreductase [Candidatus Thermoplasmatota archaeon]
MGVVRTNSHDVIVVGAGSIGLPIALDLAERGFKTLVLDRNASPGQGDNKHAIGGIRATHSDPAKILACKRSLEVFSGWERERGDDIEWLKGGYTFPAYREQEEVALRSILPVQKRFGLNIDFVSPERIMEIVPGIDPKGLRGGTHSPDDGSASPLISAHAFYKHAAAAGADFRFKEDVRSITVEGGRVVGVRTDDDRFTSEVVIDAAGAYSRELCRTAGVDIEVIPDSHEGAITEPVKPFFTTMVVDLRPGPGSKNYYFYQNRHGQVVFCITPDPPIYGTDRKETSTFLPQVAPRMIKLLPRLKNIRVRRVWRGLYPMTPDGSPFVGWNREVKGLLHATGMCGQGFMLGPGVGGTVSNLVAKKLTDDDRTILQGFDPYRKMKSAEALK